MVERYIVVARKNQEHSKIAAGVCFPDGLTVLEDYGYRLSYSDRWEVDIRNCHVSPRFSTKT